MPGGQFSHFLDKMSLARDTGHRGSILGRLASLVVLGIRIHTKIKYLVTEVDNVMMMTATV